MDIIVIIMMIIVKVMISDVTGVSVCWGCTSVDVLISAPGHVSCY